jgi:hypothetical protein
MDAADAACKTQYDALDVLDPGSAAIAYDSVQKMYLELKFPGG